MRTFDDNVQVSRVTSERIHDYVRKMRHSTGKERIPFIRKNILNLAEEHSIILSGCIPGFKRDDVEVLPSCETKTCEVTVHSGITRGPACLCVVQHFANCAISNQHKSQRKNSFHQHKSEHVLSPSPSKSYHVIQNARVYSVPLCTTKHFKYSFIPY